MAMATHRARLRCTLAAVLVAASFADGLSQTPPRRIRFARGANAATVRGAVVRGTRDIYAVGARGGQTMTIAIQSLEANAAVTISDPNGGIVEGTEEWQDATSWTGVLPATGDYQISVGPIRGNATYTLRITIR